MPLLAMALGLAAATAGLLPPAGAAAYDLVWTALMPVAVALLLLAADLRGLASTAGPALGAFLLGAAGTVAGTVAAYALVGRPLGPGGPVLAAALCASYIGGSVNYVATAQALGAGGAAAAGAAGTGSAGAAGAALLAGGLAADNVAMAGYLGLLSVWPEPDRELQGRAARAADGASGRDAAPLPRSAGTASASDSEAAAGGSGAVAAAAEADRPTAESLAVSLAAAALSVNGGRVLAAAVGAPTAGLAAAALLASGLASLEGALRAALAGAAERRARGGSAGGPPSAPPSAASTAPLSAARPARSWFAGSESLGAAAMAAFFAAVGAAADPRAAAAGAGPTLLFIAVQLSVHLAVTVGLGRLVFRLPLRQLLVASNANVGGPATAAALASARGWPELVQPALLTGTLGYAVGTAVGCAVGGALAAGAAAAGWL